MNIIIKKPLTPQEAVKRLEADGKPYGRTAGGWIADLCASKAVVLLCPLCTHKFNPKRLGYRKEKEYPYAIGKCDGCGTLDIRCSTYFWEATYHLVRSTAEDRRAEARARERQIKRGSLEH